jgi:hypothetical protein
MADDLEVGTISDNLAVICKDELSCRAIQVSYNVVSHIDLHGYTQGGQWSAVNRQSEASIALVHQSVRVSKL